GKTRCESKPNHRTQTKAPSFTQVGQRSSGPLTFRPFMTEPIETLGIIAGDHSLPLVLAREARALGVRKLVAIGFEGQSNRELEPLVDTMIWLKLGQLSKLIA